MSAVALCCILFLLSVDQAVFGRVHGLKGQANTGSAKFPEDWRMLHSPKPVVAMWSGPRNLSTAIMRSFGARADCSAVDEPFYAAYLLATGIDHPMRKEIITVGETDPETVAETCLSPDLNGVEFSYQKHMTQHMIPGFPLEWIADVTNVFLIREPARVLASYAAKRQAVAAEDIGFRRQRELFEITEEMTGRKPVVIDSHDIRRDPETMLVKLCSAIGLTFDSAMLAWEAGRKPEDGIWAEHWYDTVWRSTGFAEPEAEALPDLPEHLQQIADSVFEDYGFMREFKL
jgi:hypothetical protein